MSSKYNCAKAGTSFLKVHNWRDPIGGNMVKPFELEVMIVSKDLLRNVVQMLPTASPRDVWSGTNQRRASKFKQQVVFCCNGLECRKETTHSFWKSWSLMKRRSW